MNLKYDALDIWLQVWAVLEGLREKADRLIIAKRHLACTSSCVFHSSDPPLPPLSSLQLCILQKQNLEECATLSATCLPVHEHVNAILKSV